MPTMVMSSFVDRVPRKAMAYLVYSMFEVSPERALSYGIVSDVVPAAQLDAHVDKLTAAMLKAPRISLTSAKEYIRTGPDMPVAGAVEYARNLHATINSAAEIEACVGQLSCPLVPGIHVCFSQDVDGRASPAMTRVRRRHLGKAMKVFIFDLLPTKALRPVQGIETPLPAAARSLRPRGRRRRPTSSISQAWEEMDKLGFDGVGPQRAPHHAARADELAEHDGGGRRRSAPRS